MDKWISVEERLPETGVTVMGWVEYPTRSNYATYKFVVCLDKRTKGRGWLGCEGYTEVTHWQPLSPPPKQADKIAK